MPTKKKKYNARFPPARIKKIMQIDEDVGKVAAAVPVIISRALEMFVENLLKKADEVTSNRGARTLTPSHIKHCILSEPRFDFLKDLVSSVSDLRGDFDETASYSPSSNCSTPSFNKKQFFGGNNNPKTLPRQISTFKTRGRPRKVDKNCEGIIAAATINSTSAGTKIETKAKRFSNDISSNGVKKRKKRKREMKFVDCEEDDDGEEVPSSDTELQTVPNGNSSKTNGSIAQPPVVATMSPVLGTVNHIPHQLARASAAATIRQPLNRSKSYTPVSGRSYTPVSTKCYTPVGSTPPFIVHRSELLNSGGLTFSLTYPMMPMSPALTPITGPHGLSFSGDGRSSVVKTDEKVTFTVNPVAPWSTQGGVDEDYDA